MEKPKSSSVNTRNWVGAIFKVCVPNAMDLARYVAGLSEVKPTIDKVGRDIEKQQSDLVKMIRIPNKNYSIGETVVTQRQWKQIMGTEPWKERSYFSFHISGLRVRQGVREGDDYPATYVSWKDAVAFCEKISEMEGRAYRLPTEAEWEYACLAGVTTKYHFSDDPTDLGKYAWFKQNAWDVNEKYAHQVAQKLPNQFGLYDMHGNVWEWCSDWYNLLPNKNRKYRVLRGGSWNCICDGCSAWCRNWNTPEYRINYIGFRLAIST